METKTPSEVNVLVHSKRKRCHPNPHIYMYVALCAAVRMCLFFSPSQEFDMRSYFSYVRARVRVWVCECVLDVCVCVWECAKPFVCFFPLFYFSGGKFLCESKGGASFFSRKRRSPFDTLPPPNRKIFFGFFPHGHHLHALTDTLTYARPFSIRKKARLAVAVVAILFFFSLFLFASRKYDYVCGLKIEWRLQCIYHVHGNAREPTKKKLLMPIQYIKYNSKRFFLLRRDAQSRCFSVIVDTRNRHQPRNAGNNFLIFIF